MATEKILIFDEAGNAKRMKVRIARFLDNEPVTDSDKENIRTTLDVDGSQSGAFTTDLTTTQKLGAGTASPSHPLTVAKTGDNVKADFTNTVNANFRIGTSGSAAQIGPSTSSSLELQTGGITRWSISSSGSLSSSASEQPIDLTGNGIVQAANNLYLRSTGSSPIIFQNGSATRWTIDTSGNFVSSGGGIDFGSGASTTLDSYEEGSWTPVFAPETGSFTTMTMNVPSARYTRIGNICHVRAYIQSDSVDATGASGTLRISGLPFTAASNFMSLNIGYAANWGAAPTAGYVVSGGSLIVLTKRITGITGAISDASVADLTTGAVSNANSFILNGAYEVA